MTMVLEGPFILVDPKRCLGCHSCELACAAAHTKAGSVVGSVLAGERLQPRNRVIQVDGVKLSTQCRQCEEAPCVKVCPTGATFRTETFTAVNQGRCISCRMCMIVCPFGAIRVAATSGDRPRNAAIKCDLCMDRPGGPACVEACPTGALHVKLLHDVMMDAARSSARQFLDALESRQR